MILKILQAKETDLNLVSSILNESAIWLDSINQHLWERNELTPDRLAGDVCLGLYYLCWLEKDTVGTFKFQLEDNLIWPEIPQDDSAFIHRLAIKRAFAGKGFSTQIIDWSKSHAKEIGKRFLRLDCELRPKLCRIYENRGFNKHSEKNVGPWRVARYEFDLKNCEPFT